MNDARAFAYSASVAGGLFGIAGWMCGAPTVFPVGVAFAVIGSVAHCALLAGRELRFWS